MIIKDNSQKTIEEPLKLCLQGCIFCENAAAATTGLESPKFGNPVASNLLGRAERPLLQSPR